MKKDKLLYSISIMLIIIFVVIILIDYSKYDANTYSAPFTADILVRTIEFVLPSVILFIVAKIISNK